MQVAFSSFFLQSVVRCIDLLNYFVRKVRLCGLAWLPVVCEKKITK